jgi:hypothetical protein
MLTARTIHTGTANVQRSPQQGPRKSESNLVIHGAGSTAPNLTLRGEVLACLRFLSVLEALWLP